MSAEYNRIIYAELKEQLTERPIMVITGMRRVGKTTAVKWLLNSIKSSNKLYFDLERVEYRYLFGLNNYAEIIQALQIEGLDFTKKAYIAIDEIQLVPNIVSVIKYLYDTYNVKFIVTGSSSFYISNQFTESLAGRKQIFEMYPLSFKEFVAFKKIKTNWPTDVYHNFNAIQYTKLNAAYTEYITYGGFPEVVLSNREKQKVEMLKDIINSYTRIDIKYFTDFGRVDEVYKLMKLLASRVCSRIDYAKLASVSGINRVKIKEYLQFLEDTYFIKQVLPVAGNADKEIVLQKKLYFTDSGILNTLYPCAVAQLLENSVYNQLFIANADKEDAVKYFSKKNGQEIDFVVNGNVAIEVKQTASPADFTQLNGRVHSLKNSESIKPVLVSYLPCANEIFKDYCWAGSL